MPLPSLHQLKPRDIGYTCHVDPVGFSNGFINRKIAARLRKARGWANPEHFTFTDKTPWWNNDPLIEEYYVPPNMFVLVLDGPCLLNGTEWFYRILYDTVACWFPAFKLINAYPGIEQNVRSSTLIAREDTSTDE